MLYDNWSIIHTMELSDAIFAMDFFKLENQVFIIALNLSNEIYLIDVKEGTILLINDFTPTD